MKEIDNNDIISAQLIGLFTHQNDTQCIFYLKTCVAGVAEAAANRPTAQRLSSCVALTACFKRDTAATTVLLSWRRWAFSVYVDDLTLMHKNTYSCSFFLQKQ